MSEIWKYKKTSKVKHYFAVATDPAPVCGVGLFYAFSDIWHQDEEKLKTLKQCKRCIITIAAGPYKAAP